MSNSKPLPSFIFDVLYYLNRNQLERFSIVCRSLKNFIERYFHSKPYRIFDELRIRRWPYALRHNGVHWHPNRYRYSTQQFLAGQKANIDKFKCPWDHSAYYLFAEMRPFLGPSVRIKKTTIAVGVNSRRIEEMESISYLWRDGDIHLANQHSRNDFQLILNSPTILQCRNLSLKNTYFSLKNYKVLYTVKVIKTYDVNPACWLEFLEQPGLKPLIVVREVFHIDITGALDHICKAFSSAVLPNAFKIVFENTFYLTQFRETNKTTGEILQLKKRIPSEYNAKNLNEYCCYILERSSL